MNACRKSISKPSRERPVTCTCTGNFLLLFVFSFSFSFSFSFFLLFVSVVASSLEISDSKLHERQDGPASVQRSPSKME